MRKLLKIAKRFEALAKGNLMEASQLEKIAMAILLKNVAKHNWGFFSREDQRIHLQTVDKKSLYKPNKVKYWLEDKGKRTFQLAEGNIDKQEEKLLQEKLEEDRPNIENHWICFMIENNWLKVDLYGDIIVLTAYPNSHNSYERYINLREIFPGAYIHGKTWDKDPPKLYLDGSSGLLAVGTQENPDDRNHLDLVDIIFED